MSKYKDQLPLRDQVLYEIGRCVVNLQTVELQIKDLLLAAQFTSSADGQAKRKEQISKSTFGGLKSELFESLLVGSDAPQVLERNQTFITTNQRFVIPHAVRESYKSDLCNLIEARNHLIHQFLQEHDLDCDDCCEAALARLENLNARAFATLHVFNDFLQGQRQLAEHMVQLAQSGTLFNLMTGKPLPPGQDWLMVEEVQLLIEAGQLYADESEKVSLQKGVEHIVHKGGSKDAYTQYGCKSWQDLANKTGLFSVERQKNPATGRWEHFYRLGAKIQL